MARRQVSNKMRKLLKETREAILKEDWVEAYNRASKAFEMDPNNEDARTYLKATTRGLHAGAIKGPVRPELPLKQIQEVVSGPPVFTDPPYVFDPDIQQVSEPSDALYYSISGGDLGPSWGPRDYAPWYIHGTVAKFGLDEYGGSMYAGVHLPHGAHVWGWRAYARWDPNANHVTRLIVSLKEYDPQTHTVYRIGQTQTAVFEPGSTENVKELSQVSLDREIDNSRKTYFLDVAFGADGFQRCWFAGAVVIYTAAN